MARRRFPLRLSADSSVAAAAGGVERYAAAVVLAGFPFLDYDMTAANWHALERARSAKTRLRPKLLMEEVREKMKRVCEGTRRLKRASMFASTLIC